LGRTLHRYILREVVKSWLGVTLVLLAILLTNQVARVLSRAADDQYPRGVVLELIGLTSLQNVAVLLPIGLLLGVVLAFGRLYHDSEMAAAQACGVGPARIYSPVVVLAVVVTAFLAWLTLGLAPRAAERAFELRTEALRAGQFSPVAPGQFRTFGGGGVVVYAQGTNARGELERVFLKRAREDVIEVALAQRARHETSADGLTHTITLYDGSRYEGVPGSTRFRIVRFAEQVVPVRLPELASAPLRLEATRTSALRASSDPEARAELHWRIALPVMAIALTVLAVPMSRLRPRQGRYARVWVAILVYFLYSNLVSVGQVWIARGVLPEWLGLWWVHVLVIALALGIVALPGLRARLAHRG
jgi:lipopolysaccharide export system permease protein